MCSWPVPTALKHAPAFAVPLQVFAIVPSHMLKLYSPFPGTVSECALLVLMPDRSKVAL